MNHLLLFNEDANDTPGELMTMVWSGVPKSGTNMGRGMMFPSFSNLVAPSSILSNSLVTSCDLSSWNADAGSTGIARSKE